jgi:catechol 2,3-dioxygenase-like lactoylglutathione lyase family enzyme
MSETSQAQFRFTYFSRDYDATVAFYRDALQFPIVESWDRSPEDRGILFAAASGLIEVLLRPGGDAEHLYDERPPQGCFMVIEVDDIDQTYQRVIDADLPVQEALSTRSWGHRSFCVREPNGLTLYFFSW